MLLRSHKTLKKILFRTAAQFINKNYQNTLRKKLAVQVIIKFTKIYYNSKQYIFSLIILEIELLLNSMWFANCVCVHPRIIIYIHIYVCVCVCVSVCVCVCV